MEGIYSESGELDLTIISEKDFERKVNGMKNTGTAYAEKEFREGHSFEVKIIGPQVLKERDQAQQMATVTLPMDWKIVQRRKMVRLANELVQIGYYLEADPNLSRVLAAVIEGKMLNYSEEPQGE
ncbi:MAG: hypothetical protein OXH56_12885 [Gemmatimonadetes bacterium]|nr:hypothetical protein [Gemmatimonadota bacterium]